jgi:hypothetical protein
VRLAVRIGQVSVRLRCYGNRSRCGSQLTRNVGRQRVGLGSATAVRIRQRAALPRPGLGASATLHAGQPTSVRMRCGSHRLNVGNRSRWGAFACGLRFASARSRCGCGATATGLGAVRIRSCCLGSHRLAVRPGLGAFSYRIGGKFLPLGSCVTSSQPRVHFGEIGQSIRCTSATGLGALPRQPVLLRSGSHSATCRATSARSRCIGNVARWATDLGADAVRFASVERRQPVSLGSVRVRLAVRIGQVSVRLRCYGNRSRCGSHPVSLPRFASASGSARPRCVQLPDRGEIFAAGQLCNVQPAARAFFAKLANQYGARRQLVSVHYLGNRSCCVAVRIRQRAALPRPGLGASATLHAGQPTSVRMRCGSHRLNVGNRSRWGAFACGLRFASARSRCGCGATATGLGAVRS